MKNNFFTIKLATLVLTLAVLAAISVFAASFTDIEEGAYYSDAAERMADRGILSGYGDGMYHGDESVTRAQLAALICKMLGKADEAASLAGETAFTDVVKEAWYTGYINYAVANGIIVGDGNGKFRPDDYVKYEEVVKVVVCVIGLDENVNIDPEDWSKEYIKAADGANLLNTLIGKKGEIMLRSDIAVICDKAMAFIDGSVTSATTTTKKNSISRPADNPGVITTTAATTTERVTLGPNQLPMVPID